MATNDHGSLGDLDASFHLVSLLTSYCFPPVGDSLSWQHQCVPRAPERVPSA